MFYQFLYCRKYYELRDKAVSADINMYMYNGAECLSPRVIGPG